MSNDNPQPIARTSVTYFVDEAGDGVLFGPKGRNRLTVFHVRHGALCVRRRCWPSIG